MQSFVHFLCGTSKICFIKYLFYACLFSDFFIFLSRWLIITDYHNLQSFLWSFNLFQSFLSRWPILLLLLRIRFPSSMILCERLVINLLTSVINLPMLQMSTSPWWFLLNTSRTWSWAVRWFIGIFGYPTTWSQSIITKF